MQIEVRISSKEPRNISITILDAKKYHGHNLSIFGPKISLSAIFWPKSTDLPPRACAECTPTYQLLGLWELWWIVGDSNLGTFTINNITYLLQMHLDSRFDICLFLCKFVHLYSGGAYFTSWWNDDKNLWPLTFPNDGLQIRTINASLYFRRNTD